MNDMTEVPFEGALRVPVEQLRCAPENPRAQESVETSLIDELANSLIANGQLTPMIGYKDDDKIMVTAGSRRLSAILRAGLETAVIAIYDKQQAIDYGIAEQLAHEKLSEVDEVKLIQRYNERSDTDLANMLGKSVAYVKKHRKILHLDPQVVEAFFDGTLRYEHMLGLTYFGNCDPNELVEMANRCASNPDYFTFDRIKAEYTRMFSEWDRSNLAKHTSKTAYIKAGGILEEDLFGGSAIIHSPDILEKLATVKIAKKVADEAGVNTVLKCDKDESLWRFDVARAVDILTDEQRAEYEKLEQRLGELEEKEEVEDEDAWRQEIDKIETRLNEIEENQFDYPKDYAKHLLTVWKINPHSRDGFDVRHNVLPDGEEAREPLYEAGYLKRPEKPVAADDSEPEAPEESLSNALVDRIQKIVLHANRQLMAQMPNEILADYSTQLEGKGKPMMRFDFRPQDLPAVTLKYDKAYEKLQAAAEKRGSKPAEVRDRLAYNLLIRAHHIAGTPAAETIRIYFVPDEEFLKAYKADQLLDMLTTLKTEKQLHAEYGGLGSLSKRKKADLVKLVATLAEKNKGWLPPGFPS